MDDLYAISFIWSFFIDKSAIANYLISTFGILIIIKFIFFYLQQKPSAIFLYKQYFSKRNFEDYLGLQAEIENELVILLKRWIPEPSEDKKIVLFVDDIDRCNIEQVIDIIDGLRVILDNPEIYNRLIIITAIDETILKKALEHKYHDGNINKDNEINLMYKEYLEKIFIIGIKLNSLNQKELEEILETILPDSIDNDESIDENLDQGSNEDDDESSKESSKEDSKEDSYELSKKEKSHIKKIIKELKNATPRKIRIFYYKYLIMKKLFYIKLEEKNMINQWDKESNEKIIMDLLIHIANDKKIDDFECKINKDIFEILTYTAHMVSAI